MQKKTPRRYRRGNDKMMLVRIPNSLLLAAKRAAAAERRPLSQYIRCMIEDHLDRIPDHA